MRVRQFNVGMMEVCCYLAICDSTKKAVIIDPGGDEETILRAVADEQLAVTAILNTHGHPDHVCGNRRLHEATGAPIIMHEADEAFFARPEVDQYFAMLGLERSPAADRTVRDGDTISFGEEVLTVIHTPGHTPGGICLYAAPNLFSGDTLFAGAVGRTDFPGGSSRELRESITKRLLSLPPDTIVWPGHGYGGLRSTIAEEARSNPFLTGSMF